MKRMIQSCRIAILSCLVILLAAAPGLAQEEVSTEHQSNLSSLESWLNAPGVTGDWFGLRNDLEDFGITIEGSIIIDWSVNFAGGISTNGQALRHLTDINLTFDTEKLIGWEGGTVFVDFQNHEGPDATADDVGDLQAFSNIDADGRTQVSEIWFEQILAEGLVRIKIGKVEVNSEFAFVDMGGLFLNSSPGFSPTIQSFPSYPDPAFSVNLFVEPTDWLYFGFGIYDGSVQEGVTTGSRGPKTAFENPADLFLVGEVGFRWTLPGNDHLPGRLGIGGWGHTGTFARFDGGTDDGTAGFYLVLDQLVWHPSHAPAEDDERGIGLFFQFGWADQDVAVMDVHVSSGVQWVGPFAARPDDAAGMMFSYVHLSNETGTGLNHDFEMAIEWFYRFQVTGWLAIQPDLQYIINPGGVNGQDDALVGTLRVEVTF